MTITLRPLPLSDLHLTEGFSLPPEQAGFADLPSQSMTQGAARDGHLIEWQDQPAGFFAIDRDYGATQDFAPEEAIGLRMFLVDQAHQGKGVATGACRLLRHHPMPRTGWGHSAARASR